MGEEGEQKEEHNGAKLSFASFVYPKYVARQMEQKPHTSPGYLIVSIRFRKNMKYTICLYLCDLNKVTVDLDL